MSDRRRITTELLIAICAVLPVLVGLSLFVPVVIHYHTPNIRISDSELQEWFEYALQNEALIKELNTHRAMGVHGQFTGAESVAMADELLGIRTDLPLASLPQTAVPAVQTPALRAALKNQLYRAGLVVCDIFLEAYEAGGDERYFDAALRYALEFSDYSASMWLPRGLDLNDHAIALRVLVISRLLEKLAGRGDVSDPEDARDLLIALDAAVRLLAKRRQFTYRSNHGLMQSMGVMHAAIVAPFLPGVKENLQWIFERTDQQLKYFVTPDGVITEHSAGYQEFGLSLLAETFRYLTVLGRPIKEDWRRRYQSALEFYDHLVRPDETLPRHGDTHGKAEGIALAKISEDGLRVALIEGAASAPVESVWLSEEFGYWSERQADWHLLASWANFVAGAHKHADELSLIFWMDGEEWWTAGGYWSYGREIRRQGINWNGSNAPHLRDEPRRSVRASSLQAWYEAADLSLLHLRRDNDAGYFVDRTILRIANEIWVVIDAGGGEPEQLTDTVWLTSPTVVAAPTRDNPQLYDFRSNRSNSALGVQVLLGPGAMQKRLHASRSPFGGWVAEQGIEQPSNALLLTAPAQSWTGMAWQSRSGTTSAPPGAIGSIQWESVESWAIRVRNQDSVKTISRRGSKLTLRNGTDTQLMDLRRPLQRDQSRVAERAFAELQASIPPHRDYLASRIKTFRTALLAAGVQALALLLLVWWLRKKVSFAAPALLLLAASHIAFGVWLHVVYFAP